MEDDGMKLFIGLDVSLAKTTVCVVSEHGQIVKALRSCDEPMGFPHLSPRPLGWPLGISLTGLDG